MPIFKIDYFQVKINHILSFQRNIGVKFWRIELKKGLRRERLRDFFELYPEKFTSNALIFSVEKIIEKIFEKGVARKKKGCTFASAIEGNDIAKFFESNEPIKSSLKGKEPKIPRD